MYTKSNEAENVIHNSGPEMYKKSSQFEIVIHSSGLSE